MTPSVPMAPRGELNKYDWVKLKKDFLIFFSPVIIIYLTSVAGLLQVPNHIFTVTDLLPNQITIGSMVGYIIGQLINIFRKLQDGPAPK